MSRRSAGLIVERQERTEVCEVGVTIAVDVAAVVDFIGSEQDAEVGQVDDAVPVEILGAGRVTDKLDDLERIDAGLDDGAIAEIRCLEADAGRWRSGRRSRSRRTRARSIRR
jgi:hypothetical protein